MNKLLNTEIFDIFLLEEASISTSSTYHIDGRINREFYSPEDLEDITICPFEFALWKNMRPLAFDLIKGKRTPLNFKFVFHLQPEYVEPILSKGGASISPQQIKAFVLTVKFDGQKVVLLTGTSFRTFLVDKEPDILWDNAFLKFLSKNEIAYEVL